ncbi:MAG: apolipoprotein N-acyltransferase [Caldiserica bacterium]|nr:apolipoprotein N-acyltransferase [Caldisericota bacterium]
MKKTVFPFILFPVLLSLSYPPVSAGFVAWIAFIPFFWGLENRNNREAFFYSLFSGYIFYSLHLWWLTNITRLGTIVLIFYLSLYFALFGVLVKKVKYSLLLLPSFWVVLEWIRGYLFTGFPWSPLANTQFLHPYFLRILPFTGFYGLSYILLLFNLLLYLYLRTKEKKYLILALALPLIFLFLGSNPPAKNKPISLGIISGNFSQEEKWQEDSKEKIFSYYASLAHTLNGVDLVILPESAIPTIISQDEDMLHKIINLSNSINIPLLTGILSSEKGNLYNSVFLIDGDRVEGIYRKIKLVPFGEYLPLKRFFPFLQKIAKGVGNFSPGSNFTLFQVRNTKFATLICFENIFPQFARRFSSPGFWVVITDDSSFKSKAAAWQHFSHSVMRAAEFSKPLVQVSNLGVSGEVSARGEITSLLKGAGGEKITITPDYRKTFYARFGDWFIFLQILVILLAFIWRCSIRGSGVHRKNIA